MIVSTPALSALARGGGITLPRNPNALDCGESSKGERCQRKDRFRIKAEPWISYR